MTRVVLLIVAPGQLLPGLLAFFAPSAFYDLIASYEPENDHFVRDLGSWQIGLGLLALLAANRPAIHVPALAVLAVQFTLHTVSHVIDVGAAEAAWQGPFALATQALGAVVLTALLIKELRS
jgi:hypothetical protein